MRVRLSVFIFAMVLLATLGSSSAAQEVSATPQSSAEPARLTTLPGSVLDATLKSAQGSYFRLSDYSGKILVVNLWATWCIPCRFETPALVKLHKQDRSRGVNVVELSTENPELSTAEVRKWVRDFNVPYRVGWATSEVALILMQGRNVLPQTLVIAPSGKIVRRFVGYNHEQTPLRFEEAIEEALNEKADLNNEPQM